jgi:hypothetical protein
MSNSQCATEPELADPQADPVQKISEGAPRLLKGLLIGFAATVTIGLALASWYVGVRIVDAKEAVPASAAPSSLTPPAPSKQEGATVAPRRALYLQVAGLGPQRDASFVKGLAAKGYSARIQSPANGGGSQILIGPFDGPSALENARRQLQSAGVLVIELAY